MFNKPTAIPRIINTTPEKKSVEWGMPGQVSAAFMFIDKFGYTFIAKVKAEKKHWWNRSWKTFVAHDTSPDAAFAKGLGFLGNYGYTINPDTFRLADVTGDQDKL